MEVKQIYSIMNSVTSEILGETSLVAEDLSNIVDVGTSVFNATSVDNYVKTLIDHIGKVVFVNRPYRGSVPSVLMDGWEFGAILEKVNAELPLATENETWELTDGTSYDPNIFYKPTVNAKFFGDKRVTFEIPVSISDKTVKESFSSVGQLNGFISMIYNAVDKSMTTKLDGLVMRTINNMIAETVYSEMPSGTYTGTSVKAVNLLKLYNDATGSTLTASDCITDPEFIRYASYEMSLYENRLSRISKLFNVGGKDRFTPTDMLHCVLLAEFAKSADAYLQSSTYHNQFTKLPNAEVVPYWQASGTGYAFADTSKINVKTASGHSITFGGVLGVMFDRDALGVTNMDRRVTTNYNPKAEFTNSWFKMDAHYFNDLNENFVVFYVA